MPLIETADKQWKHRSMVYSRSSDISGSTRKLHFDFVLPDTQDEATLRSLAEAVYAKHNGGSYDYVQITWRLAHAAEHAPPWAISTLPKDSPARGMTTAYP